MTPPRSTLTPRRAALVEELVSWLSVYFLLYHGRSGCIDVHYTGNWIVVGTVDHNGEPSVDFHTFDQFVERYGDYITDYYGEWEHEPERAMRLFDALDHYYQTGRVPELPAT